MAVRKSTRRQKDHTEMAIDHKIWFVFLRMIVVRKHIEVFLFNCKLIRFWILHPNWDRLNLFIFYVPRFAYLERQF